MAAWLFMDRLLPEVTTRDLSETIASYGTVERVLVFKSSTGYHIGFVEMAAEGDASKAAQAVNECNLFGEQTRAILIQRSDR